MTQNLATKNPSVVVLGGGTGTFMMLQALKRLPVDLTAVLTMVDDGGSNRMLRDQFGLLPTSGVSQCIVALSEDDTVLRELFNYRFHQGEGISGMRFGNLFMAAVTDIVGSQKEAIQETQRLLRVKGKILPVSFDDVRLVATYEDGSEVVGEHEIDEPKHDGKLKITGLRTEPKARLDESAKQAIAQADYIVMGPGDFFTNTIANFAVEGVNEALLASPAKKIFVTNLMTKFGETYEFTLQTFLDQIDHYYDLDGLDYVIINNNLGYPEDALQKYKEQNSIPVEDDITGDTYKNVQLLRADLVSTATYKKAKGDNLNRSILRHSPRKFAEFFQEKFLA
jgi:uncharacterized cofD-like protein